MSGTTPLGAGKRSAVEVPLVQNESDSSESRYLQYERSAEAAEQMGALGTALEQYQLAQQEAHGTSKSFDADIERVKKAQFAAERYADVYEGVRNVSSGSASIDSRLHDVRGHTRPKRGQKENDFDSELAAALKEYEEIAKKAPQSFTVQMETGRFLLDNYFDAEKARPYFAQALSVAKGKGDVIAAHEASTFLYITYDKNAAHQQIDHRRKEARSLVERANVMLKGPPPDIEGAAKLFRDAAAIDSDDPRVYDNVGDFFRDQARHNPNYWTDAEKYYRKAANTVGKDSNLKELVAEVIKKQKEVQEELAKHNASTSGATPQP